MAKSPQRRIEYALIDGIGPVSVQELMGWPEVRWGLLRQAITDAWRGKPKRHIARCLMCSDGVFVQARAFRNLRLPLFAHFKGATAQCPWFSGDPQHPNAVRAGQYEGRQESVAHRLLCNQIATLAEADPNCSSVEIGRYLPPTENSHGRYPDVLVTFRSGRRIAFEVQLSNTFQTEISDRCLHYEREGVPLIWVLLGAELRGGELPQSFRDLILRHRGNAFALDQKAVEASIKRRRLHLSCFYRDPDGKFDDGRLVSVEDLTFPETGCPYFEDKITPDLLSHGENMRRPWKLALRSRSDAFDHADLNDKAFISANEGLCQKIPDLLHWQNTTIQGRWLFCHFMAVLFSMLSAAAGQFRNYATRQDNVQAMLNSKLSNNDIIPFAQIIHSVIYRTALSHVVDGSVGAHLCRALSKGEGNFILEQEGVWDAVHSLLPEIFDPALRLQLQTLGTLPDWAKSDRAHLAFRFE